MTDALKMVLVVSVVTMVVWAAALGYVLWRLRRRNRVCPTVASAAPLIWLASPARGARLHRRLRAAVATARLTPLGARGHAQAGPLADMADELEGHAAAVDDQLVLACAAPTYARRRLLDAVEAQVRGIELLARRIADTAQELRRPLEPTGPAALARMGERLDALDAARAEIADLERSYRLGPDVADQPALRPRP